MNDREIRDIIETVADDAMHGRSWCDGYCWPRSDAHPGTVPPDYAERYAKLLGKRGFGLRRGTFRSEGIDGCTYGHASDDPRAGTVVIKRGLSPARELNVMAHESAHVLLRHSSDEHARKVVETIMRDAWRLRVHPSRLECVDDEIPAELAAAAVTAAAGNPVESYSRHYVNNRIRDYGRPITEQHIQDALYAARIIINEVVNE